MFVKLILLFLKTAIVTAPRRIVATVRAILAMKKLARISRIQPIQHWFRMNA